MNKTSRNKIRKPNKNHPWKQHSPNLFKSISCEAIDRHIFEGITKTLIRKMKKTTYGAEIKPC